MVRNSLSDFLKLISGVVQGTVVGPLMFLMYINELINILETYGIKIKMFAHDVKLYLRIINDADVSMLEHALTALSQWARDWQLTISVEKCCVMRLGTVDMSHKLSVDGYVLPVNGSCRNLDIIINKDLSFTEHVNSIVCKAHLRANAIHWWFESCKVVMLISCSVLIWYMSDLC